MSRKLAPRQIWKLRNGETVVIHKIDPSGHLDYPVYGFDPNVMSADEALKLTPAEINTSFCWTLRGKEYKMGENNDRDLVEYLGIFAPTQKKTSKMKLDNLYGD